MSSSIGVIAMCCFAAVQAIPSGYGAFGGGGGGGDHGDVKLTAVPDLSGFSKLTYPDFNLQDLGTHSHGHLPAKEVKVIRTIKITVPQPFPVKIPHKVPYPVPVAKPYPVQVTKLVPHPVAVPVEVIKSVPVPVEVPKPYPVPQHEYNERHNGGGESQQSQDWQPLGHQQQQFDQSSYASGSQGLGAHDGHADQSAAYAAVIAAHQQNYAADQQNQDGQQQGDDHQQHQ